MKIQKADIGDLYDMMELAQSGELDHHHNFDCMDYASWFGEWSQVLEHEMGGVLVAKKQDRICGALGWQYGRDTYSNVEVAQGVFWWVLQEYEASRLRIKLLEEFLLYVDGQGLDAEITLDANSSPRSVWVLERYGFGMDNVTMRRMKHYGQEGE